MIAFISDLGALSNQLDHNGNPIPISAVPSALRERRVSELMQSLSETGVEVTGGGDGWVSLNLRHLALKAGSLQRGWTALYEALGLLNAVAVTIEGQDVQYINGNTVESHAIARALESNLQPITDLLTRITPDELHTNLDQAETAVYQDRLPDNLDPRVADRINGGAQADLVRAGLLSLEDLQYRDQFDDDPRTQDPLERYMYQQEEPVKAWKSPFDTDGEL